jgi:hypothetical protein
VAFVLVTPASSAAGAKRAAAQKSLNPHDAASVERARSGASRKLGDPDCSAVLTDFKDRAGRTLAENLEPWGMSAAEYLRAIRFLDGISIPRCKRESVIMATAPGLPTVFVCPAGIALNSRLAAIESRSPALAEAMVIHEMLHTLGLGENPPSSFEITERIRERCR